MDAPVREPGATTRDQRIELRVTKSGKQAIADLASAEERTFSDMVRTLLARGLAASMNSTTPPTTTPRAPRGKKGSHD